MTAPEAPKNGSVNGLAVMHAPVPPFLLSFRSPFRSQVGYEREFVVPRLLERKRVDDLAESMKDG